MQTKSYSELSDREQNALAVIVADRWKAARETFGRQLTEDEAMTIVRNVLDGKL